MSHSTPATYLVWTLLTSLVGPLLPFAGNGPENRVILIAGDLPDLSSLVLRPLQMPKVRIHHPSFALTHPVERAVRWNQGTQGAFKRVMTVCHQLR